MKEIFYTEDYEDRAGRRCENVMSGMKCHRREGHSSNTITRKVLENDTEIVIEFNHRGSMGGRFFTW